MMIRTRNRTVKQRKAETQEVCDEQEKTRKIIHSLSKKYTTLRDNGKSSGKKCSQRKKMSSVYDFDAGQEDDIRLRLELSPEPKKKLSKVKTVRKTVTKHGSRLQQLKPAKAREKTSQPKKQRSSTRLKSRTPVSSRRLQSTDEILRESEAADSGVFMTPPSGILAVESNAVTSTPSPLKEAHSSSTPADSVPMCPDFLSPVMKDPESHIHGELVTSQISLYDMSEDENSSPATGSPKPSPGKHRSKGQVSKDKRKTKKQTQGVPKKYQESINKAEELAMKMAAEFQELEDSFALNIQDE